MPSNSAASTRRDLRLLAGAVFLSAAGDLLALVTLAVRMHDLTGSGVMVSALFAAALVPIVALAPLAGLVTDRFESVRVLAAASLAQAAVAAALAFTGSPGLILVLAALLAAGNAFAQPAEFTLIPAVAADPRWATAATGIVEAARYAGFAAGPALAAALAVAGPRPALLVNAATFVAIALAAGSLRARRPGTAASAQRLRALQGVYLLREDRDLRLTIGAAVGSLLFMSATPMLQILYVREVLGAGATAYALLVCAWMAGMVVGATALARRVPTPLVATAALAAVTIQGAGIAAQTAWAILPMAFAGYLVGGLAHGAKNVLLRTLLASRVPANAHGRAFAAYNAARNTAELGALIAGGVLVSATGPRAALLLAGAGAATAGAAGLARRARRANPSPSARSPRRRRADRPATSPTAPRNGSHTR